MNRLPKFGPGVGRRALVVLTGLIALAALLFFSNRPVAEVDSGRFRSHPPLFTGSAVCPTTGDPAVVGSRAEHTATSRAHRYPYDPRDGVLAVDAYEIASSCYAASGRIVDADRTRTAATLLMARVSTDYAAARLSLMRSVETKHWDDVIREARHLQQLTSHLGGHGYVEWLEATKGEALAMQHTEP